MLASACQLLLPLVLLVGLQPLTPLAGDARNGLAVFVDRERGHCLLCHQARQVPDGFQGNLGPDLSNVGARLDAPALRARIVDPARANAHTIMPAYHKWQGLNDVAPEYQNRPILSAQEVEDLVAFLQTLEISQ